MKILLAKILPMLREGTDGKRDQKYTHGNTVCESLCPSSRRPPKGNSTGSLKYLGAEDSHLLVLSAAVSGRTI